MNDIKLKPCPFCGDKAYLHTHCKLIVKGYSVSCRHGNCHGGQNHTHVIYDTKEKAIDAWNKRFKDE